jgi:hypothetical protein
MFNRGPGARERDVDENARLRALLTSADGPQRAEGPTPLPSGDEQPPLPVVVPVPSPSAADSVIEVARHPLDAAMELTRAAMSAVDRLQTQAAEREAAAAARQKEMEQEIGLLNERLRLLLADNARKEERLRQLRLEKEQEAGEREALEGALRAMLATVRAERGVSRAATENLVRTRAWLADFEKKAELVLAAFPAAPPAKD